MKNIYNLLGYFFCELCFKWDRFCDWAIDPAWIGVGEVLSWPFVMSYKLGCWFYAKGPSE